jgi:hypothetical protein
MFLLAAIFFLLVVRVLEGLGKIQPCSGPSQSYPNLIKDDIRCPWDIHVKGELLHRVEMGKCKGGARFQGGNTVPHARLVQLLPSRGRGWALQLPRHDCPRPGGCTPAWQAAFRGTGSGRWPVQATTTLLAVRRPGGDATF